MHTTTAQIHYSRVVFFLSIGKSDKNNGWIFIAAVRASVLAKGRFRFVSTKFPA
jgi:hypothetical protein